MEQTINRVSKEIAWTISNAILDNEMEELGNLTLSQLLKIRDIIESETISLLSDMVENNKNVYEILDRI